MDRLSDLLPILSVFTFVTALPISLYVCHCLTNQYLRLSLPYQSVFKFVTVLLSLSTFVIVYKCLSSLLLLDVCTLSIYFTYLIYLICAVTSSQPSYHHKMSVSYILQINFSLKISQVISKRLSAPVVISHLISL